MTFLEEFFQEAAKYRYAAFEVTELFSGVLGERERIIEVQL